MQQSPRWNTAVVLVAQVATVAVSIVCAPLLVKALGAPRLGLLSMLQVLLGYFSILDLGLSRATARMSARAASVGDRQLESDTLWTALLMQFGVGAVAAVGLIAGRTWLLTKALGVPPELGFDAVPSLVVMSCALPFAIASNSFIGILQAHNRFSNVAGNQMAVSGASWVVGVAVAIWSGRLLGVAIVWCALRIVSFLWLAAVARSAIGASGRPSFLAGDRLSEFVAFGGWVTVGSLVAPVLTSGERIVLSSTMGVAAAAYYSLPADAISRALIVAASLSVAYFPKFALHHDGAGEVDERETYFTALKEVTILTGIPIVMVAALAPDLLLLWLGREFATQGALALRILAAGTLFLAMAHIPVTFSQAIGKPAVSVRRHLLEVPIHLLAVFGLGRAFGLPGYAAAWSLRTVLDFGLQHAASRRLMRGASAGELSTLGKVTFLLGAQCVATVAAAWAFGSPVARVAAGASVALATIVATWRYGLSASERDALVLEFRRGAA